MFSAYCIAECLFTRYFGNHIMEKEVCGLFGVEFTVLAVLWTIYLRMQCTDCCVEDVL